MKKWYPVSQFSEQDIIRKIMRDTWMAGYNVKSIADYFKLSLCSVYNKVNVTQLKKKKAAKTINPAAFLLS